MIGKKSFPGRVLAGALLLVAGVRRTAPEHSVRLTYSWLLVAFFTVSLILNALGIYFLWDISAWSGQESVTFDFLRAALRVVGVLLVFLVSPLLALSLCNLLFPLFSDLTFMAGLRITSPQLAHALEQNTGLTTSASIGISLRRFFGLLPFLIACFLLGFIPVLGPTLAPPLLFFFASRAIGSELLDPYFDRRGLGWHERGDAVNEHFPEVLGMGLLCAPLLGIPLLGPVFFGVFQAGCSHFVEILFEEGDRDPSGLE